MHITSFYKILHITNIIALQKTYLNYFIYVIAMLFNIWICYLNFNHSSHDVCTSKELLWLTLLSASAISISNLFFYVSTYICIPFYRHFKSSWNSVKLYSSSCDISTYIDMYTSGKFILYFIFTSKKNY